MSKGFSILLAILLIGCAIPVVSPPPEKQDEYLKEQKTSTELSPEKTISKEAFRYYKQALEKKGIGFEFSGTPEQEIVEVVDVILIEKPRVQPEDLPATEEAIKLLKKAIEADPYYHAAHYELGLSYRLIGQLEIAEKELFIASSLKPLFSAGHTELGEVCQELGKLMSFKN